MSRLTVYRGGDTFTVLADAGQTFLDALQKNNLSVSAPCGGKGTCGHCRLRVRENGNTREILACRTVVTQDAEVLLPEQAAVTQNIKAAFKTVGAAVDIGTTTVAAMLSFGDGVESRTVLNPQQVFGADVASRISACREGNLERQTRLIRDCVNGLLRSLCEAHGLSRLPCVTVCGNPTMLHLFCGVNPLSLGEAPYTPVFRKRRESDAVAIADKTVILPLIAGFLGSDTVCAVRACRLTEGAPKLLLDLGTNGELVLYNGKHLFATSTAAGPALEGAGLSCGTGGVDGAICAVRMRNDRLVCETVNNQKPVGLCGSGALDVIALLLEIGLLDRTGTFVHTCRHPLRARLASDRFLLTDTVYLTQEDVRQFQLAKAAVCAAALTLCDAAAIAPEDIAEIKLAGGLGYYLSEQSALRTGLLPSAFGGKITSVGNAALDGALLCLDEREQDAATLLADRVTVCDLTSDALFAQRFVREMNFN